MSGGSFDYAGIVTNMDDLLAKRRQYRELAEAFEAEGWDDIAAEIFGLLDVLDMAERRIDARLTRLYNATHAMEWFKSGDYGRTQVEREVQKLRGETPE